MKKLILISALLFSFNGWAQSVSSGNPILNFLPLIVIGTLIYLGTRIIPRWMVRRHILKEEIGDGKGKKGFNLKYKEDRFWTIFIGTTLLFIIFLVRGPDSLFSFIYVIFYVIGVIYWWIKSVNTLGPYPENSRHFNLAERIDFLQDMVDGTYKTGSGVHAADQKYKPELDDLKERYKSVIGDYDQFRKNHKEAKKTSEVEHQARSDSMVYGSYASEIICPHCNTKGQVRKKSKEIKEESREKGIIGATIGRKIITKKGSVTQLHCDNCGVTWTV